MVIGIDAREAQKLKSGKATYTFNLIKNLIEAHPECSFVLYSKEPLPQFAKTNVENVVINKKHFLWHMAVMRNWSMRAALNPDSVYFAPTSFIIPALLPKRFTRVITVHDLIAFRERTHQHKAQILEKLFARRAVRNAEHIIVPSHNTARDLAALFPGAVGKIKVTPLGIEKDFFNKPAEPKRVLPKQYILTVGGLEPRKNIATLIHAFLALPSEFSQYRLVIVGGKGWHSKNTEHLIAEHANRIMHLTDVSHEELPALYANASVFVFPSLYEGFGLPPLEAMAAGCPVICSNAASLPEVCGEAAIMCDPTQIHDFTGALSRLLADPQLQESLKSAGRERAQGFSWANASELTFHAFVA